jgi:DNA invertase Pin-like site-specific DNA recombinase
MIDRPRSIDLNKITPEQEERITKALSDKLSKILESAAKEANAILNTYGIEVQIAYKVKKKSKIKKKS